VSVLAGSEEIIRKGIMYFEAPTQDEFRKCMKAAYQPDIDIAFVVKNEGEI
jgi:hypothetical protein